MSEEKSIFPATSMAHENPKFPSLATESSSAGATFSSPSQNSFFPATSMATDTQVTLAAGKEESTVQTSNTDKSEPVEESSTQEPSPEQEPEEPPVDKVFCKSCLAPKGTTEAGTADEPLRNFGELAILQSAPEDSEPGTPLHNMAASGALTLKGATDLAKLKLPKLGAMRISVGGVMARIPLLALFFSNKVGDGTLASMEEINQAGAIESRVRFNFYVDKDGKEFVSGYHDGSGMSGYGEPIRSVEAEEDKNSSSKSYIADLGGGTIITWFPEESDKTLLNTPLPRSQRIDPSTILVRPIDSEVITTTIYPEEELMELIVTFPPNSGIEPLYLVFQARGPDGRFISTGEPKPLLGRTSLRAETKRKIQFNAPKDRNGSFIDEEGNVLTDWQYGHKKGVENRRVIRAAEELDMTQEELNDFVNAKPDYFQIEDRRTNLSHANEKPGNGDLNKIKRDMKKFLTKRNNQQ